MTLFRNIISNGLTAWASLSHLWSNKHRSMCLGYLHSRGYRQDIIWIAIHWQLFSIEYTLDLVKVVIYTLLLEIFATCLFHDFDVRIFRDTWISRFCENLIFWITLITGFEHHNLNFMGNNVKIAKHNSGTKCQLYNKAVFTTSTSSSSYLYVNFESIDHNIHLRWKFLPEEQWKKKKKKTFQW